MAKISQQTTDLIVTSVINLVIAEIPELIKFFQAKPETVTEAEALARLDATGLPLIARNEAWLIMKGALSIADEPPDPTL